MTNEQFLTDAMRRIAEATRPPFFAASQRKAHRMAKDALAYVGADAGEGAVAGANDGRLADLSAIVPLLAQAWEHAARAGLGAHFASELHHLTETARANMDAAVVAAGKEAR